MKDLKDAGVNISISSFLSIASAVGVVWFFIQPVLISQVGDALGQEMDNKIKEQQRPIESAFKALLLADINRLKKSIALLEYREQHDPEGWEPQHAELLAEHKIELEALQEAYSEL